MFNISTTPSTLVWLFILYLYLFNPLDFTACYALNFVALFADDMNFTGYDVRA